VRQECWHTRNNVAVPIVTDREMVLDLTDARRVTGSMGRRRNVSPQQTGTNGRVAVQRERIRSFRSSRVTTANGTPDLQ
jgi:hypothetical protein